MCLVRCWFVDCSFLYERAMEELRTRSCEDLSLYKTKLGLRLGSEGGNYFDLGGPVSRETRLSCQNQGLFPMLKVRIYH